MALRRSFTPSAVGPRVFGDTFPAMSRLSTLRSCPLHVLLCPMLCSIATSVSRRVAPAFCRSSGLCRGGAIVRLAPLLRRASEWVRGFWPGVAPPWHLTRGLLSFRSPSAAFDCALCGEMCGCLRVCVRVGSALRSRPLGPPFPRVARFFSFSLSDALLPPSSRRALLRLQF